MLEYAKGVALLAIVVVQVPGAVVGFVAAAVFASVRRGWREFDRFVDWARD